MLRVIDTETTGLEGGPETVVEIASVAHIGTPT